MHTKLYELPQDESAGVIFAYPLSLSSSYPPVSLPAFAISASECPPAPRGVDVEDLVRPSVSNTLPSPRTCPDEDNDDRGNALSELPSRAKQKGTKLSVQVKVCFTQKAVVLTQGCHMTSELNCTALPKWHGERDR